MVSLSSDDSVAAGKGSDGGSKDVEEVKENEEGMREERSGDTDEEMDECKEDSDSEVSLSSSSSSSESDNIISTKTPQTRKRQREELKRK